MFGNGRTLGPALVEAVLQRLGLSRVPEPDFAGLAAVYAAWCRRVPFDNVRKLIHLHARDPGPLPGDDAEDFFTAWLKHGTGGTCWSGNGALQALLVSLGFDARRGIGTMLAAPDLPPNHGTVTVVTDGRRYVVDASMLHGEPFELKEFEQTGVCHPAWGVVCTHAAEGWRIRWRPLHRPEGMDCRIDNLDVGRGEFRERHEQTRAWSPFNYELNLRLIRDEGVIGICFGRRVAFGQSGAAKQQPLDADERRRVLTEDFGLTEEIVARLPRDCATPSPPGSRSAVQSAIRSAGDATADRPD